MSRRDWGEVRASNEPDCRGRRGDHTHDGDHLAASVAALASNDVDRDQDTLDCLSGRTDTGRRNEIGIIPLLCTEHDSGASRREQKYAGHKDERSRRGVPSAISSVGRNDWMYRARLNAQSV